MNKTKIPWCDYTVNPVKGLCPVACPYCYARRLYRRYHWNTAIRADLSVFIDLPRKPSKIFVGSTIDLFHPLCLKWNDEILSICERNPEHTFMFLTKEYRYLKRWSLFPENCWVGATVTTNGDMTRAYFGLNEIQAGKRFISFEPLLGQIGMNDHVKLETFVDWVIIGRQTPLNNKILFHKERVKEIVDAADKGGIPVFLKDNLHMGDITIDDKWALSPRLGHGEFYRQEFP